MIWVFIDIILMITNYHYYKNTNNWYHLFFVIIFAILAICVAWMTEKQMDVKKLMPHLKELLIERMTDERTK